VTHGGWIREMLGVFADRLGCHFPEPVGRKQHQVIGGSCEPDGGRTAGSGSATFLSAWVRPNHQRITLKWAPNLNKYTRGCLSLKKTAQYVQKKMKNSRMNHYANFFPAN
jgi:hypothetical protein